MKKKYYAILYILEILYENKFFILKNKVHPSKKFKKIYR